MMLLLILIVDKESTKAFEQVLLFGGRRLRLTSNTPSQN